MTSQNSHIVARSYRPTDDPPDGNATLVRIVAEGSDQHLKWSIFDFRRRHGFDDRLKERLQVLLRIVELGCRGALFRDGIQHRKLELIGLGCQVEK